MVGGGVVLKSDKFPNKGERERERSSFPPSFFLRVNEEDHRLRQGTVGRSVVVVCSGLVRNRKDMLLGGEKKKTIFPCRPFLFPALLESLFRRSPFLSVVVASSIFSFSPAATAHFPPRVQKRASWTRKKEMEGGRKEENPPPSLPPK